MLKTHGFDPKFLSSGFGLALGSGGARGVAHIAFLEVLDELNLRPRVIAGSSIGAVIGALYAGGMPAREIREVFLGLNLVELGRLVDLKLGNKHGLVAGKKIERRLKQLIRTAGFEDLQIPLRVVATDFWAGERVVLEQGPVHQAVRASLSIPGIFVPVLRGGRVLMDGGSTNPLPYDVLEMEPEAVIAVDVNGERMSQAPRGQMPTLADAILSAYEIQQDLLIRNRMQSRPPGIYIKTPCKDIGMLDFHRAAEVLELVQEDARALREVLARSQ